MTPMRKSSNISNSVVWQPFPVKKLLARKQDLMRQKKRLLFYQQLFVIVIMFTCKLFSVNSFISSRAQKRIVQNGIPYSNFLTSRIIINRSAPVTIRLSDSPSSWMEKNERFERSTTNSSNDVQKKNKRGNYAKKRDEIPLGVTIRNDSSDATSSATAQQRSPTFREEFRGTRVFVQNIPTAASWQDLKDHFRIAGNVVFASVSRNPVHGTSKGCGVVQFETVAEAQNAIAIMRNHPMNGAEQQLYVREDVQEQQASGDVYASFKNQRMGGGSGVLRSERMNKKWSCADEESNAALSDAAKENIMALLRARDAARFRRNYEASDTMREELKKTYNVRLDDRTFLWWINFSDPNETKTDKSSGKKAAKTTTMPPWQQIPSTPENDLCVDANLVNALLVQRDIARREKDFSTADRLLEKATNAPDGDHLKLRIHDESRTWRIWTNDPPPRLKFSGDESKKIRTNSAGAKPNDIVNQCIALVSKYDPEKVEQVSELLRQFPDRQETIFSKLRQRYMNSGNDL